VQAAEETLSRRNNWSEKKPDDRQLQVQKIKGKLERRHKSSEEHRSEKGAGDPTRRRAALN
jgi:hypothetical protein